jgi:hypothetical protein
MIEAKFGGGLDGIANLRQVVPNAERPWEWEWEVNPPTELIDETPTD